MGPARHDTKPIKYTQLSCKEGAHNFRPRQAPSLPRTAECTPAQARAPRQSGDELELLVVLFLRDDLGDDLVLREEAAVHPVAQPRRVVDLVEVGGG